MTTVTTRAALAAALLLVLALPPAVSAHSEFVSGTPQNGATVGPGRIDVVATFSEDLAATSHMELLDASGTVVARAAVDGDQMRIGLEGLQPGQYEVRWTSVARDGDVLRSKPGEWTFEVAAGESPTASVEPSVSAAASATSPPPSASVGPSASPSSSNTGTASGGDVLLPILAAVVAIGILAGYLLRRRSAVSR